MYIYVLLTRPQITRFAKSTPAVCLCYSIHSHRPYRHTPLAQTPHYGIDS